MAERPGEKSPELRRVAAGIALHEGRFDREPAGFARAGLDKDDARSDAAVCVHGAQALGLESGISKGAPEARELACGIHEADSRPATDRAACGAREQRELAGTCAGNLGAAGEASSAGRHVRWIAHHEVGPGRRDVPRVARDDRPAPFPAVRFQVPTRGIARDGIDLDEHHPLGSVEVEERQPDRPGACPEVDGHACPMPVRGKGGEQERVHVGAVALAAGGLGQSNAPSEEGVLAHGVTPDGDVAVWYGARPRMVIHVTDGPANAWTTFVPSRVS